MKVLYLNSCPVCHGSVSDEELLKSGTCKLCEGKKEKLFSVLSWVEEFESFFKDCFGFELTRLQKNWCIKFFKDRSFSIFAPTGIGKTTFGLALAIYLALQGKRTYIITLTSVLVHRIYKKLLSLAEEKGYPVKVASYSSYLTPKEKEVNLQRIKESDFHILVTTERFLAQRFDEFLFGKKFDLIFIDDVDSFLRSSKNVDKVLYLLGYEKALENLDALLQEKAEPRERGILIVSGATAKVRRSKRVLLLRELLGFGIGFSPEFVRNIDTYELKVEDMERFILDFIKKYGGGGLIFVPMAKGIEEAHRICDFLSKNGIRAVVFESTKKRLIDKFASGEIDVLLGVASYRSPIARGIDLPTRIRYVIFAGVPRTEIRLRYEENPIRMLTLLRNLQDFLEDNYLKARAQRFVEALSRHVQRYLYEGYVDEVLMKKVEEFLNEILTEDLLKKIRESETGILEEKGGEFYLIISDPTGFIQASGRCSRLYAGGISKGVAILINDCEKAKNDLVKKIRYFMEEFEVMEYKEERVEKSMEEVDRDRERIRLILEGKLSLKKEEFFETALLIVESPTKARTISRFFGRPSKRVIEGITVYETIIGKYLANVVATQGHIFELSDTGEIFGIDRIDGKFVLRFNFIKKCVECGEQFVDGNECPKCKSKNVTSKESFIKVLRELAIEVDRIFIVTDFDSEGEKIAYDVYVHLASLNRNIKRLEIHEITRGALLRALESPLEINEKMVEAQLTRRAEDRLVGYSLSELLQKVFHSKVLSAGRVQSPVLKWIVERVKEFSKKKNVLTLTLENGLQLRFEFEEKVENVEENLVEVSVEESEETLNPPPPYTTDAMLRDANLYLKMSSQKAMRVAQQLFETGLITYIRTDSTTVSSAGIRVAEEYLKKKKLEGNFQPRKYFKEGAHECIRPTRPIDATELRQLVNLRLMRLAIKLGGEHFALYNLIFKRFLASQSKPAKVRKQRIVAKLLDREVELSRPVEVVEEGFLRFSYLKLWDRVESGKYRISEFKWRKVPVAWPFKEGEVIEKMKEEGIGRPSTYAMIVRKLFERRYVKETGVGIVPTRLGKKVLQFLLENYGSFISEERTRLLEEKMDRIERGEVDYQDVILSVVEELKENELL